MKKPSKPPETIEEAKALISSLSEQYYLNPFESAEKIIKWHYDFTNLSWWAGVRDAPEGAEYTSMKEFIKEFNIKENDL